MEGAAPALKALHRTPGWVPPCWFGRELAKGFCPTGWPSKEPALPGGGLRAAGGRREPSGHETSWATDAEGLRGLPEPRGAVPGTAVPALCPLSRATARPGRRLLCKDVVTL